MELRISKTLSRDKNQYAYLCFDNASRSEKILRRLTSDRAQKVVHAISALKTTNPTFSDLLVDYSPLKPSLAATKVIQNVPIITLQDQIKVRKEKKLAFSHDELFQLFDFFLKLSKQALYLSNVLKFEDFSTCHFKKYPNRPNYQIDFFELIPHTLPSQDLDEIKALKFNHRVVEILKETFYMQFNNKKKKEDPSEFLLAKTYDLPIELTQLIVSTLTKIKKAKTLEEQITKLGTLTEECKKLTIPKETKITKEVNPFLEEIKNSEIYCVSGGPALIKFCNSYMYLTSVTSQSTMATKMFDIIVEKCDYIELDAIATSSLRDVFSLSLSSSDGAAFHKKILLVSNKIRQHGHFFENVENLDLDGISYNDACFRRLFQTRGFENLTYLSLNCAELTSKALLSLKHSSIRKLQSLSLDHSFKKFDVTHLILFFKWSALTSMKSIKLHKIYNEINVYLHLILNEFRFEQLDSLLLDHCGIDDKIVDGIIGSKSASQLKELKLSPNTISEKGFARLLQSLALVNLDISYSQNLNDEVFLEILKNPSLQQLEYLNTYRSHLTEKTAKVAEEVLKKLKGHRTGPFDHYHKAI